MKSLTNLMMSDFIEMLCGNLDVLKEKGENVSERVLSEQRKMLTLNYKMIVNPASVRAVIFSRAEQQRRKAKWIILKNCLCLLSLDAFSETVLVMESIGYRLKDLSLPYVKSKIKSEMKYIEYMQKRENEISRKETVTESVDIRDLFDKEQASIMTYYKMVIDRNKTSASVYGNMVAQAAREIKVLKDTVRKMKT